MNKRIKELMINCNYVVDGTCDTSREQKFAELIVRECLNIVEPDQDSGDEWCVTLKGAAQEIKEHFGVSE
jgi:hypothetical protein